MNSSSSIKLAFSQITHSNFASSETHGHFATTRHEINWTYELPLFLELVSPGDFGGAPWPKVKSTLKSNPYIAWLRPIKQI